MEKIALGMSGGVDSSAAAVLLKNQGYCVLGTTLRLFDNSPLEDNALSSEALEAKKVCERLNIEHICIDLRKEFSKSVIDYFINEYERGNTPNPCVFCNKTIKFGLMEQKAKDLGINKVATGHYAKISESGGRFLIQKPTDLSKDQTYVLYSLSQEQLSRAVFPLGELTKAEARQLAQISGLENANKKDSQDICFVPDGDYAKFISGYLNKSFPEGNFISPDGKILGRHKGIINYTVGQRKGLGIAIGKPAFVTQKNVLDNTVTLDNETALFYRFVEVDNTNFLPFDTLGEDLKVKAKLRYRQQEQPAVLHPIDTNRLIIEFEKPQRAPSAGQSAVFYDGDILLGGGIIVKGANLL